MTEILDALVDYVNRHSFRYKVVHVNVQTSPEWVPILEEVKKRDGGHCDIYEGSSLADYLVAVRRDTDDVVAFVGYREYVDVKVRKRKRDAPLTYSMLVFEFGCTRLSEVRQGLSLLLRAVLVKYAENHGYDSVVSSAGSKSRPLLQHKLGFEIITDDDVDFVPESSIDPSFLNARLLLKQEPAMRVFRSLQRELLSASYLVERY
jgi:hypothetical protein